MVSGQASGQPGTLRCNNILVTELPYFTVHEPLLCYALDMRRIVRIVASGFLHHLTQHVCRCYDVVEASIDPQEHVHSVGRRVAQYGLSLWTICSMTRHIDLAGGLRDAHPIYAMYLNSRTALSEKVWQRRSYTFFFPGQS